MQDKCPKCGCDDPPEIGCNCLMDLKHWVILVSTFTIMFGIAYLVVLCLGVT